MKNLDKAIVSLKEISTVLESGVTQTNPLYTVNVKSEDGEHQVFINREERLEALMDIALNELDAVIEILEEPSPTAATVNEDIHQCDICDKYNATLANEDDTWICEDCAQYMSDLGNELS